ncbi:MAG: NnrS family protein [Candidatus Eisenbacteria bacterium]
MIARVHRPFFLAAIVTTLTAGVGWGAFLLLRIASDRSFTKLSIFEVNAHAQAQIYGWIGLFILGFAYEAFPRFRGTPLPAPRLARASLVAMLLGIVLRSVGEPLHDRPLFAALAIAGSILQIGAVALFAFVLFRVYQYRGAAQTRHFENHDFYILSAAVWFLAGSFVDLFHVTRLVAAPTKEALLHQVAGWQFALRDLQIHGLAMMMIFGVSQRIFPIAFGSAEPSRRLLSWLWIPLDLAILGEAVGFVRFMQTRAPLWAAVMGISILVLTAGAVAFVLTMRLWKPLPRAGRSGRFLRASHVWLLVSMAMLATAPLYFKLSGVAFSHAWYGAMRHAITVGFLSLTVLGVSSKVIPSLAGRRPETGSRMLAPFLLVNAGCALRVTMQVLTDFTPAAYPIAGISGLLELTGLTIWGIELIRILLARNEIAVTQSGAGAPLRSDPMDIHLSPTIAPPPRRRTAS